MGKRKAVKCSRVNSETKAARDLEKIMIRLRLQLFYLANCFRWFILYMFMFMYRTLWLKSSKQ